MDPPLKGGERTRKLRTSSRTGNFCKPELSRRLNGRVVEEVVVGMEKTRFFFFFFFFFFIYIFVFYLYFPSFSFSFIISFHFLDQEQPSSASTPTGE